MSPTQHRRRCVALSLLLAVAIRPSVAQGLSKNTEERYEPRAPMSLTVPRHPIARKDYVDFVRPWAADYQMTPEGDQWQWRHGPLRILPPLAVFAFEGDSDLGERIKRDMHTFAQWVDHSVEEKGVVFCLDATTISVLCFEELRKHHQMTEEDERWAKEMLLKIRRYQPAWAENGPWDGWFRGSHHRAQAQGINNAIASHLYPDETGAKDWRTLSDVIWRDWWDFRDVGINDVWYFHSSFGNILRAACILGREEVFTDAHSRRLFEQILSETSPDGSEIPYGASCGYNVVAGSRVAALELASRYTRDGRYRWVAHRLMNNCQARPFCGNSPMGSKAIADIAVASLVCDDSVEPVEPKAESNIFYRKEIVRLTDAQVRERFPGYGGVDCNTYMTQNSMPSKLVFRSGWDPGDLFMLVECYARHDPLNPTAIIGLEHNGVAMAEMASEKFVPRENAVAIADRSGTATYLGQKGFQGEKKLPKGWSGMASAVPVFSEHALAVHARVDVTEYQGFNATQQREFLFVKNRFVLVRDETTFADSFRAEVGPIWNTQHVSEVRGSNWINTWFSAHYFDNTLLFEEKPWDLLLWYAPREDVSLNVMPDRAEEAQRGSHIFPTQYAWEGQVEPEQRLQFVTVLMPHAPTPDASSLAKGIAILADQPGVAAVQIGDGPHFEIAILNSDGTMLELHASAGTISTDARALYADIEGNAPRHVLVKQGTALSFRGQNVFHSPTRTDYEK
ncbi:MAG: hypothetical protein K1Y02_24725 [Candidatus Hydrogenedentes bacterium]|nr:hypothetical protein [Candidatus Hydrogenedentota bacterium]